MRSVLSGIETEYGLYVEGHGAEHQLEDAAQLVSCYPGSAFVGWDYRFESPRSDLRGFSVTKLAEDPEDTKFDVGSTRTHDRDLHRDRVLPNGARFYNDHGHPEYATPETWSLHELALQDGLGEAHVLSAARIFAEQIGRSVKVFKNNTDFHKASYGTHESYLIPRGFGFQRLYEAVMPMLVARQIITGAGKVGCDHGAACAYQISQRADFFAETANVETLYRRPIFNTRDEPHADPHEWMRLHVISGDANMMPDCTARRVGLVKLALALLEAGQTPIWRVADPVRAFEDVSKDDRFEFRIDLSGGSWTTAYDVLESYFSTAERVLELDPDTEWVIRDSREALQCLRTDFKAFSARVDWAAKRRLLETVMAEDGLDWNSPGLQSYDLEYHNIDRGEGLYSAWDEMGEVKHSPPPKMNAPRTRAFARGLAVSRFQDTLMSVCWRRLTFKGPDGTPMEVDLPPDAAYPEELEGIADVGSFIAAVRGVK
jgi:proteasome accessory factor A